MSKRRTISLLVFVLCMLIVPVLLTAANPWPARFEIVNQTENDMYLVLYGDDGLIAYNLPVDGEPPLLPFDREEFIKDNTSIFTIERDVYKAELTACGVVLEGRLDLTTNLKLNLTPCEEMIRFNQPRYLGEPTLEKPNFFRPPEVGGWRFKFVVPDIDKETFPEFPETTPTEE